MPLILERMNTILQARHGEDSEYGYIPNQSTAIAFIVLYAISTSLHTGQAVYYRKWWLFPTIILGGCGEILGWSGRLWSSKNIRAEMAFMIQISTIIISPTFILAVNFIIFGQVIRLLGTSYSRLRATLYAKVFLSADIISLIVQGIGGGMASSAQTLEDANRGGNVMLGGIVFQLFIISMYMILAIEFMIRYNSDKPFVRDEFTPRGELTTRIKIMLGGLGFNTLTLFIRAIYRTIELSDGWNGRIITTEVYFNVLDGAMVVLAIYTFNIFHPGLMLPKHIPTPLSRKNDDDNSKLQL